MGSCTPLRERGALDQGRRQDSDDASPNSTWHCRAHNLMTVYSNSSSISQCCFEILKLSKSHKENSSRRTLPASLLSKTSCAHADHVTWWRDNSILDVDLLAIQLDSRNAIYGLHNEYGAIWRRPLQRFHNVRRYAYAVTMGHRLRYK